MLLLFKLRKGEEKTMKIKLKPIKTKRDRILFGFKIAVIIAFLFFLVYLNVLKFVEPYKEILPSDMRDEPILIADKDSLTI